MATIGRDHPVVEVEGRERADRDRLLPTAEMHRAGDLVPEPKLEDAFLEPPDREHPAIGTDEVET